jgi:hypothetical protein
MDNYPFLKKHMDEKKNETGDYFSKRRVEEYTFSAFQHYYLGLATGARSIAHGIELFVADMMAQAAAAQKDKQQS